MCGRHMSCSTSQTALNVNVWNFIFIYLYIFMLYILYLHVNQDHCQSFKMTRAVEDLLAERSKILCNVLDTI